MMNPVDAFESHTSPVGKPEIVTITRL